MPTMSKGLGKQLKLVRKVADVVLRANKKICVTLLGYSMVKPKIFYAQGR